MYFASTLFHSDMDLTRKYQRCVAGHFHPIEFLSKPITHRPLMEIDDKGNFPHRNLVPGTISSCPAPIANTDLLVKEVETLTSRVKELQLERDSLVKLVQDNSFYQKCLSSQKRDQIDSNQSATSTMTI